VSLYTALIRPALFSLDAERAHDLTMGLLRSWAGRALLPVVAGRVDDPILRQRCWDLDFANPLGLAAGLDKQGHAAGAWAAVGFGFAEIGTVTPEPQPGNPRPRLFRLRDDRAIINRFGFNSEGAVAVAGHLRSVQRGSARLGVNVGRNKDTANDRAVDDYIRAVELLREHADYFVVNVSSPNTAGLRSLQQAHELRSLVEQVVRAVSRSEQGRHVPVLVKVSPDEPVPALLDSVASALEGGAAGVVATNTTITRDGLGAPAALTNQAGGLSGTPLRQTANTVCREIYRRFGSRVPIIGVGGISNADEAYERIRAGASLIQIYTALIYEGPEVVSRILRGLAERLRRDGFTQVREAIGVDVH
jgi:dihydroorotate dehydrogenase